MYDLLTYLLIWFFGLLMPWLGLLMIIGCNTFSCPTSMVYMVMMAAVDDRPGRWPLRGNNRYRNNRRGGCPLR